jgi:hypothetical protein
MKMAERNRMAVGSLLADADRVLALADLADVRGDKEFVDDAIANARKNYLELMCRRKPLILEDAEETRFQSIMARLLTRIKFFGESA